MMRPVPLDAQRWTAANHRQLSGCVAQLAALLERFLDDPDAYTKPAALDRAAPLQPPAALEALVATFGLSEFARGVLLLTLAVELDGRVASAVARCRGGSSVHPTFALALRLLPGANWEDLAPSGPLRAWGLVELHAVRSVAHAEVWIAPRVALAVQALQPHELGIRRLLADVDEPPDLPATHAALADQLAAHWTARGGEDVIVLHGPCPDSMGDVATRAAGMVGHRALRLHARDLPTDLRELDDLARSWALEARLVADLLVVDATDLGDEERAGWLAMDRFLAGCSAPTVVFAREPRPLDRSSTRLWAVPRPTRLEQRGLWARELGANAPAPLLDRVSDAFDLSQAQIVHAVRSTGADPVAAVWSHCLEQQRQGFAGLAERRIAAVGWDDLVLTEPVQEVLRQLVAQLRHRTKVLDQWGLGRAGDARGVVALFAGASGTGKTLAASVIAGDLGLDLHQIDLSRLVSKYIGETEDNLRKVFDAAERSGSILLFDEADALFGRRTEIKDSHDRNANVGVSYLLQRLDSFRGLAILTTNMRESIDSAFQRRFRFVVDFPFPDRDARARIWRQLLDARVPTSGVDLDRAAQLHFSGGQIRNVLLNAAYFAADADTAVDMQMLRRAARLEAEKMKRPLTSEELRGWPA